MITPSILPLTENSPRMIKSQLLTGSIIHLSPNYLLLGSSSFCSVYVLALFHQISFSLSWSLRVSLSGSSTVSDQWALMVKLSNILNLCHATYCACPHASLFILVNALVLVPEVWQWFQHKFLAKKYLSWGGVIVLMFFALFSSSPSLLFSCFHLPLILIPTPQHIYFIHFPYPSLSHESRTRQEDIQFWIL